MTRHKADINAECDRLKSDAGVEDLLDLVSIKNGHADKGKNLQNSILIL